MQNNKFLSIYQDLLEKIQNNTYRPKSKLPSEHELTELYDTSRETARKALHLLAQNGYIQKVRGKGSIVLPLDKLNFPVSGLVSFKEVFQKVGKKVTTQVHELSLCQPDEEIQHHLNVKSGEKVWKLIRTREIDGERIILDKDYLLQEKVPTLTKEVGENSIYEYLEGELGLSISFAKKEITVEEVEQEDVELLDLEGQTHIVVVKNYVYLEDTSIFQYTESRHRLDKFRFVDFARRAHL
ncbi:trehalose operon repressor [Pseudalkalibacillus sp. R45]|uniref:trehalose operon repressor n=1 Tax=Pseudalkalibacillus sp. R45 TaxID=3457433 RepID=UPI003FCEA47A